MSILHEWYQTDSKIIITVKTSCEENNYNVKIERSQIMISIQKCVLELNLLHPVVPAKCTFKKKAKEIEISLAKETVARWESLEKNVVALKSTVPTTNWDKFANEFAEIDKTLMLKDLTLYNLCQRIYSEGSLVFQQEMNKSSQEPHETVLSMHRKEVSGKKVEGNHRKTFEFSKFKQFFIRFF